MSIQTEIGDIPLEFVKWYECSSPKCSRAFNLVTKYMEHFQREHPNEVSSLPKNLPAAALKGHVLYRTDQEELRKWRNSTTERPMQQRTEVATASKAVAGPSRLIQPKEEGTTEQKRRVPCTVCGNTFYSKYNMERHKKSLHVVVSSKSTTGNKSKSKLLL